MLIENLSFKRIWMLSDIHMGVSANSKEWLENQMDYFKNFFIPLLKQKYEEGDILVILGDLYDNRQSVEILIDNMTQELIYELSKYIPVHLLCGNHDMYNKVDNEINSLNKFRFFNNVKIHTQPTILTNGVSKILMLPYSEDYDVSLDIIDNSGCEYLFAHADILSMKLDNGNQIKKGLNLSKSSLKRVYSGHIHKRQEKNKIVYIGSPYHTKYSDVGNDKGVYIFSPDQCSHEFIKNDYSPIFQNIHLSVILNNTLGEVKKILNNNYSTIIVPPEHLATFNLSQFIDMLDGCNYKNIKASQGKTIEDEMLEPISFEDSESSLLDIMIQKIKDMEFNVDDKALDEAVSTRIVNLVVNYYKTANE